VCWGSKRGSERAKKVRVGGRVAQQKEIKETSENPFYGTKIPRVSRAVRDGDTGKDSGKQIRGQKKGVQVSSDRWEKKKKLTKRKKRASREERFI